MARAGAAAGRRHCRRAASSHLRLDSPDIAPGTGAGSVGPDRPVSDAAGLPAHMGPECAEESVPSRFFSSRSMVFLGTYSYGLYVYHHFISYYLIANRTELDLARRLGSHGVAIALPGLARRVGLSRPRLFELRTVREAVPRLKAALRAAKKPVPHSSLLPACPEDAPFARTGPCNHLSSPAQRIEMKLGWA